MEVVQAQRQPGVLRIFISYRRLDAPSYARELYHVLSSRFTDSQIFWDIKMELGVDFVKEIERAVGSCDVLVAVIGPNWLNITDEKGQRRLDDPSDFVRLEIATALERDIRVIPVLVQSATMPSARELPEALQSLSRRSAIELSDKRWDYDVHELIASLERVPYQKLVPPTGREPFPAEEQSAEKIGTVRVTRNESTTGNETTTQTDGHSGERRDWLERVPHIPIVPASIALGVAVLILIFLLVSPKPSDNTPPQATPSVAATRAPIAATQTVGTVRSSPTPTLVAFNFADELTDFGVQPLFVLQTPDRIATPTPTTIPGGTVIRTMDLASALKQAASKFVLIDALDDSSHATIPGAESVPDAGDSGTFVDSVQQSLEDEYNDLTTDYSTPMVFFCEGARCWESYNASLRAIHMGYTHVYWYRGGLEAWRAAGLPTVNP